MKRISIFALLCCSITLLCSSCIRDDGKTLYLFNWTYYTPDSVIEAFEKEFDVRVKVDNFASNEEMFAKMLAGASSYDIIVPTQDYVSILIKLDMLQQIDKTRIPNLKYISPAVEQKVHYDPNFDYSVPYFMGAAGVVVNTEKVPEYEKSWSIFGRKDLAGRMSMMDDMREVMGDALAYTGKSVNSLNLQDLEKAKDIIIQEWKPNLVKFDSEGFGKSFAAGDFWVVQGFPEVVFGEVPQSEWDTLDFFIPKEGGPMYIDSMCVPKQAKHYDLAMEFINFILRPDIYAMFLDTFNFPSTIHTEAGKYMKETPMYTPEELEPCEIKEDLAEGLMVYDSLWQKIRFTK